MIRLVPGYRDRCQAPKHVIILHLWIATGIIHDWNCTTLDIFHCQLISRLSFSWCPFFISYLQSLIRHAFTWFCVLHFVCIVRTMTTMIEVLLTSSGLGWNAFQRGICRHISHIQTSTRLLYVLNRDTRIHTVSPNIDIINLADWSCSVFLVSLE